MIKHGLIPPSVNSAPVDSRANFNFVVDKPVKANINTVLINSLSYEGHASSIVVQRLQ
jgi:3-oxoacyl-(acyl-carrier-protein) synthase